jgi:hypothetical protein
MKNGISLKFPSFVGHFRAASGMKGAGFKHWSHWKIYQYWLSISRLGSDEDITGLPERNPHIPIVTFIILSYVIFFIICSKLHRNWYIHFII